MPRLFFHCSIPSARTIIYAEFLADIVLGFLFGFLIAYCWEQYFRLRLSEDSDHRLSAPIWLGILGFAVFVMAVCSDVRLAASSY